MYDVIKEILISIKEFRKSNYKRFQKNLVYIRSNLIGFDGGMYLTVDSFIEINSTVVDLNNITLRRVNVRPQGFDKMYMDKELIEDKLYQTIDQFNERKISNTKFYSILFKKNHSFYDGIGRMCKILVTNSDITR